MKSMGSGSIMELSRKQKINGRSSTEAKIMGVDEALLQCLWSIYFIDEQLYAVEELKYHQDTVSAMLMGKMLKSQE